MGVYIFQSTRGPYIKVGHYKGTNAWSRVAHRGFSSCVCPPAIRDAVSIEHLRLHAWFPRLSTKDERAVKTRWRAHRLCGGKSEWFPEHLLDEIYAFLTTLDESDLTLCDQAQACATRRRL
ncbi:hypothetical protein EBZ80_20530 [bacterium]|nr:hypothetical protein [bacterium]